MVSTGLYWALHCTADYSRMAGRLDEEQTAVDTGILNVTLTLRGEFLAEVCRVLVLDVLDDGVPAEQC